MSPYFFCHPNMVFLCTKCRPNVQLMEIIIIIIIIITLNTANGRLHFYAANGGQFIS